jgi:hypothetical protein
VLRDAGDYDRIVAGMADLRQSLAGMRKAEFVASDAAYTNWNRTLVSFIQRVDEFQAGNLMTGADTYERLEGLAKELASNVRDFQESPKKYLRLRLF